MIETSLNSAILSNTNRIYTKKCAIYLLIFFVTICLILSVTDTICFILCLVVGNLIVYSIFCYKIVILKFITKSILLLGKSNVFSTHNDVFTKTCSVCDKVNCVRHLNNVRDPWINIHIHKQLDESIENFFNTLLKKFIIPWYSRLTKEDTLLIEIRFLLRYASSSLLQRLLKVDIGHIISNKLIPCALHHYSICDEARHVMETKGMLNLENAALIGPLKKRIHPALLSRKMEMKYLKFLTDKIMPYLLPGKYLQNRLCKVLVQEIFAGWVLLSITDILADPNIINTLIILATSDKKLTKLPDLPNHHVEFLLNFVKNDSYKQMRLLSLDVKNVNDMLKSPEHLYAFMQFMKSEGKIHILQFCLDIDEFNKKMLQPEMNKLEKEALFKCASDLFNNYFSSDSLSYIPFNKEYIDQFQNILNEGPNNIEKLQTSRVIYEAYDYVFTLLDQLWAPKFIDSEEFFHLMVSNVVTDPKKPSTNLFNPFFTYKSETSKKQENSSLIGKPFIKLKDAFKTQAVDGHLIDVDDLPTNSNMDNDLNDVIDIEMQLSEILANYTTIKSKDMGLWKVSIDDIIEKKAPNKSGVRDWFIITVNKVDPHELEEDSQWSVERNDHDMYVLKEKLIEFHGEAALGDCNIPSKRIKTPSHIRKLKYESFLQNLLLIPLLRSSDLLHMFLTADGDFSNFAAQAKSDSANNVDISSLYQTVTHKLRKEKGQHLENFLQAFLISSNVNYYHNLNDDRKNKDINCDEEATDAVNDVNSELSDDGRFFDRRLNKSIFENNFNISDTIKKFSFSIKDKKIDLKFSSSLIYMLSEVFHVRESVLNMVHFINECDEIDFDTFFDEFLNKILCDLLPPTRLGYLIKLGQDIIFNDTPSSKLKLDRSTKAEIAKYELQNAFPFIFNALLGPKFLKGVNTLFEFLQYPKLNKQFVYSMLEIVILELFPEINKDNLK